MNNETGVPWSFWVIGAITLIYAVAGSEIGPMIGNLVQVTVTAFLIWYSKRAESKQWIRAG